MLAWWWLPGTRREVTMKGHGVEMCEKGPENYMKIVHTFFIQRLYKFFSHANSLEMLCL